MVFDVILDIFARMVLLALASGIITSTIIGIVLRRSKRRRLWLWVLFGLSDFTVLYLADPIALYILLAFKNSMVMTVLALWAYDDIKLKGWPWIR